MLLALHGLVLTSRLGSAELLRALASNVLAAGITKHEHFSVHYSKLGQSLFKEQWSRRAWLSEGISKSGFADWKGANLLLEQAFRVSNPKPTKAPALFPLFFGPWFAYKYTHFPFCLSPTVL